MENMILLLTTLALVLSALLMIINSLIALSKVVEREKGTPFECGYDPKSSARVPFSLHFFLVAVIFLIFDVEITILLPMPMILNNTSSTMWLVLTMLFIGILLLGTIHEWKKGALDWSK